MEQLIQKYIRYFYTALIGGIVIQLIDVVLVSLRGEIQWTTIFLMVLSIVNIILLGSNMWHNIKQHFTECKLNSKILRFTVAILIIIQALLCFIKDKDIIMLGNHLMTIVLIEIVLNYRINSIEHLEELATQFAKEQELEKGG